MRLFFLAVLLALLDFPSYSHGVTLPWPGDSEPWAKATFRCFSDSALCTMEKRLGKGGFGGSWKVQVQLDEVHLQSSQSHAALMIRQHEPLIARELGDSDLDGRRFYVVAKFANKQDEEARKNTLQEATSWARLPHHPDVIDLLHVDMFSGGRLVLYSEYLEGAMDLERALWEGARLLVSDDCAKERLEPTMTDEEYEAAVNTLADLDVVAGYTKKERDDAAYLVSRCERMGKMSLVQHVFGGEPEVQLDSHSKKDCSSARVIVDASAARWAKLGGCPMSDSSGTCAQILARVAQYEKFEYDRSLLLDRVAWQLAAGLKHVHDNGFTHFDISPDNVIVTPGLDVYLTDFGSSSDSGKMGPTKQFNPCEWDGGRLCSKKGTWFQMYPPCNGVDTYELAFTLTLLYSGYGYHEVYNKRGKDFSFKGPENFLLRPLENRCTGSRGGAIFQKMPSFAYDNRSNKHLPKMSSSVEGVLKRMLSRDSSSRASDVQELIDAIEAPYGSKEDAMREMGLVNEVSRVNDFDEPGKKVGAKVSDACKHKHLVSGDSKYEDAKMGVLEAVTFANRARSFLAAARAADHVDSGFSEKLRKRTAFELNKLAHDAALHSVRFSSTEADLTVALGLLNETEVALGLFWWQKSWRRIAIRLLPWVEVDSGGKTVITIALSIALILASAYASKVGFSKTKKSKKTPSSPVKDNQRPIYVTSSPVGVSRSASLNRRNSPSKINKARSLSRETTRESRETTRVVNEVLSKSIERSAAGKSPGRNGGSRNEGQVEGRIYDGGSYGMIRRSSSNKSYN